MEDLDKLIHQSWNSRKRSNLVGEGKQAKVYRVTDDVLIKVLKKDSRGRTAEEIAKKEFTIGTKLHEFGFPVPKYLGITSPFDLDSNPLIPDFLKPSVYGWGVLMTKMPGVHPSELTDKDQFLDAKNKYLALLDQLVQAGGYVVVDIKKRVINSPEYVFPKNRLYCQDTGKLSLIDMDAITRFNLPNSVENYLDAFLYIRNCPWDEIKIL